MTTSETIEGTVETRRETGIRVNGTWLTVSKFKPVELPEVGAVVSATVDAKGFISSLNVRERAQVSTAADRTTLRLAALQAAATFAAGKSQTAEIGSRDVLKIAEAWLAWLNEET